MDRIDCALINRYQSGVPLGTMPYHDMGAALGLSGDEVIERIKRMLEAGELTRFGPLYNVEEMGGVFTLCAIKVERRRFEAVTEMVNRYPQVAHNYEREHALNMWFVVAAESAAESERVITAIESETGCPVLRLPKLEEFYVGLFLPCDEEAFDENT